jgi:hypothetical protein
VSWDFGTFIEMLLAIFVLSSFGWLKFRSNSSDQKKKIIRILVVCIAIVIAATFGTVSRLWSPRAEVTGTVIESYASRTRFDNSYFRVQSSSGQIVRLETVKGLARSIDTTQTVDVVYEVWSSHPLEIKITSGDNPGILLSSEDGNHLSGFVILVLLASLGFSVLNISKLRKLPADAKV